MVITMGYIEFIRSKVGHDKIILNYVGAAIYNDSGKVLLQRRSDRRTWGFPGGAMELGESISETAKREIKEETGLDIKLERLIGIYSDYSDEYPNGDSAQPIVIFFLGKVISGKLSIDDNETLELKYFGKDEMPQLVNKQHTDMFHDLFSGKKEVIIA